MAVLVFKKNIGVVFFLALIVVALVLFVSDKFSSKAMDKTTYEKGGRLAETESPGGSAVPGLSSALDFKRVNWQDSLNALSGGGSEMTTDTSYDPFALRVDQNSTIASFKIYLLELKYSLRRYANPKLQNEVDIMLNAYDQKDELSLAAIADLQEIHRGSIADLLKVQVPIETVVQHTDLLNSLNRLVGLDDTMKNIFKASELALTAGKIYTSETVKFYNVLAQISAAAAAKGVKITDQEQVDLYLGARI